MNTQKDNGIDKNQFCPHQGHKNIGQKKHTHNKTIIFGQQKKEYKNQPLPSHAGYKRLVITLEKEKRYEETIEVCKKALSQKWAGDWEHRIERCEKKLNKKNT